MADGASPGPLFADGKADGAMRTIGEVSAAFGIKPHVLRYWEQQFPTLQPLKRSGGRRLYRAEDVAMVETINRLVNHEGYTLKGAKKAIASGKAEAKPEEADKAVASVAPSGADDLFSPAAALLAATPAPSGPPPHVLRELRAIRDRLAAALA